MMIGMIKTKDLYDLPIITLAAFAMLTENEHATSLALCVLWLCVLFGATGIFAFIATTAMIESDGIESLSDAAKLQCKRAKREHADPGRFESCRMKAKAFIMAAPFLIIAMAGYVVLGVIGCVVAVWFLAARMSLAETAIKAEAEKHEEFSDE
jgi:hypothetical protein